MGMQQQFSENDNDQQVVQTPVQHSASKGQHLKEVGIFYVLTFIFTWMFWGSQALYHQGIISPPSWFKSIFIESTLAAWGPSLMAVILTLVFLGKSELISFVKKGWNRDFSRNYGVFAIFSLPVVIGGAMVIGMLFSNHNPELPWVNNYLFIIVLPIVVLFIAGPLQEEYGWRGFVQTRLLVHFNKWIVGTFIGFTWALWHLPLFWVPGTFGYYQEPLFGIYISTIALSIIMVSLYEKTSKSLLPMLLFHTMFNSSHVLFPVFGNDVASLWYLILLVALAIGVIIYDEYNSRKLN